MHFAQFPFVARHRLAAFALLAASSSVPLAVNAQQAARHDHRPAAVALPSAATTQVPVISTLASVPQPQSMFDRYRRFDADTPLLDWVSANKTVQQIGGWRAYAREAAAATGQTPPLRPITPATTGAAK